MTAHSAPDHDRTVHIDELAELFERYAADTHCIHRPHEQGLAVDIVGPGRMCSRERHIEFANREAEGSYRNRSRDHNAAADVLHLHPAGLDFVTTT